MQNIPPATRAVLGTKDKRKFSICVIWAWKTWKYGSAKQSIHLFNACLRWVFLGLGAAKINPVSWPPASTNTGCSHYRLFNIYCVQRSMQLHLWWRWSRSWRQQIGNTWSRLLVIISSTVIKAIDQELSGSLRDGSSSTEEGAEAPETSSVVHTSDAKAERKSKP